MNKIFKVVWSKVKNCYVVVSEVAKNVITGSIKSAKIGSTPMTKGLALGAMMAFVITGNAWAAEYSLPNGNNIKNNSFTNFTVSGRYVFGETGSSVENVVAKTNGYFHYVEDDLCFWTGYTGSKDGTVSNCTLIIKDNKIDRKKAIILLGCYILYMIYILNR